MKNDGVGLLLLPRSKVIQATPAENHAEVHEKREMMKVANRAARCRDLFRIQYQAASMSLQTLLSKILMPCTICRISLTENHSVMDSTLNSVVLNENARLNPAFDQWELNMTHAYHEGLEATGFEPPGAPPVLVKPQEKPRDNRHCL